jgi:hypothetical protein
MAELIVVVLAATLVAQAVNIMAQTRNKNRRLA